MIDEFTIRQMSPSDLNSIKQVIDLSFSRFLRFFAFHSLHDEGQVLVSEVQKTLVGFVKLIEFQVGKSKFGCVLWVAVHPHYRRRGLATALINAGIKHLKADNARAIFASVQRRNIASLSVLEKIGFRKMGFLELWRLFGWRLFKFYIDIWLAPSEIVLKHEESNLMSLNNGNILCQ